MNKVLITGNAGLLGSNLADYIVANTNYKVYGIDDLSGGYIENVNDKIQFCRINIMNDKFDKIFEQIKPDYVYHMAAYAAEGLSPFIREFNYTNNLLCTARIINNCIKHNVKRLIFTSTMATYGDNNVPYDEDMIPRPIDPYGIAKYACELDIKAAGVQHGLDWCIIRPHNVYGKKQNIWDKYRNVLGIWMYQLLNNKPISIFGDGEQKRAFSYIDDSVGPLFKAMSEPLASKQIINLGGIHECTINEAADTLLDIVGYGTKQHLEGRHEIKYAYSTYKKSVDILGFRHITSLHDGLKDMWSWAQKQTPKKQFIWDSYELDNGLYTFWKNKKQ